MEVQLNARLDSLPQNTRLLFDPRHKLAEDIDFIPDQTNPVDFRLRLWIMGVLTGGIFGCTGLFGLAQMTFSLLDGSIKSTGTGDTLVIVGVYGVMAGLIVIAWRAFWLPLWYQWLSLQEKAANTLRRGVFMTPDALIVRMATDRCDLFPRGSILAVELRPVRSARRRSSHSLCLTYRAAGGGKKDYFLSDHIDFGWLENEETAARIRVWAGLPG